MARSQKDILELFSLQVPSKDSENPIYAEFRELEANTSRVSVWHYAKQVVAFVIHTLERLFDQHKLEVKETLAKQQAGTLQWYVNQAYAFQYGYALALKDGKADYMDTSSEEADKARIVKHASGNEFKRTIQLKSGSILKANSVLENGIPLDEDRTLSGDLDVHIPSGLEIKVVKESNGEFVPLDSSELAAFESYMEQIKFAGIWIRVVKEKFI